jgi:protein-S-isoprenylcysteine O-methyltransferase Ste14
MNQAGHRPPAGRGWFLGGYAGLAGFFGLELGLREGGAAASLDATSADQGTTAMIVGAFSAALILAPIVRRLPRTQLPALAGPTGLVIEGAGLAVRAWSMAELKASYTRTLRIEGNQGLIESGPYRYLRHPGYLGSLLTWTGFALASRSIPVTALVGGLLGGAYRRRILAEEELLERELPGYAEYARRTSRLIPGLW